MIRAISGGLGTAIRAALGTAVIGGRVYLSMAAQGAALPYVVLTPVGGGDENATPRDAMDVLWQTDVVADDGAEALGHAETIRAALHMTAGGSAEPVVLGYGWALQTILHETPVYWVEQVERRQYHHAVDTYRIIATK